MIPPMWFRPSRAISGGREAVMVGAHLSLRGMRTLIAGPAFLFLSALTAMLLRPPDVSFFEIDRIGFLLLGASVAGGAAIGRERLSVVQRATWPMIGLTLIAVTSAPGEQFDHQTWSLLMARFIVPFSLFHLSQLVFRIEGRLLQFERFSLLILAYLTFMAIAFLLGAKSLIFPRFILDQSLGYHADRARGPLLQAVANGVSLNLLGLIALHSYSHGRLRNWKAFLLLTSLPVAVMATMTRAVWLAFAGSVGVLLFRSPHRKLRRICGFVAMMGILGLVSTLCFDDHERVLSDRLNESGPIDFREAVYAAGWQMFLEKPLTGWGENEMPSKLARHVSGYRERELYPHNTYLELLVEHGLVGLAFYVWIMWELLRLGSGRIPSAERGGFLNRSFHEMWPIFLGVYLVNAAVVGMNYQFVNGLLFTLAGMLAAQHSRGRRELKRRVFRSSGAAVAFSS